MVVVDDVFFRTSVEAEAEVDSLVDLCGVVDKELLLDRDGVEGCSDEYQPHPFPETSDILDATMVIILF